MKLVDMIYLLEIETQYCIFPWGDQIKSNLNYDGMMRTIDSDLTKFGLGETATFSEPTYELYNIFLGLSIITMVKLVHHSME